VTSARKAHSVSKSCAASSGTNASASSAVAVRCASTTTSGRVSTRRRPSKRGFVSAGSARQTTTTSARSRISPNVAVLDPIA
jgi:hypothetical protein